MTSRQLWIDDVRPPPEDGAWDWAKTSAEALELLIESEYDLVSWDHDLGGADTSMRVAQFIETLANSGDMPPPKWRIPSANPGGRQNLEAALTSADRIWEHRTAKADWE